MKKLSALILAAITLLTFGGCSKDTFMDVSAFTDYYNKAVGSKKIELGDYLIREGTYSLFMQEEGEELLLTLETAEEGKIDEIRLLIPKVNNEGEEKQITEKGRSFFTARLAFILEAYTVFTPEECRQIISDMKLDLLSSFNSRGELTLTKGDWHMIYYSTQISSVFMIYNIHLHPIEKTEKPQSKPAFGNTAYTRKEENRNY